MKRAFDIGVSFIGLVLLFPVLVVVALAVRLGSGSPVLFRQQRMGKDFRRFAIYKFRTMIVEAPSKGDSITCAGDNRVTWIGAILREFKVDELPQLMNVLNGDMSFVGPRPEMPEFVALFEQDYRDILRVRPGITDLASLKYHNEAEILGQFDNPRDAYVRRILPDKIALAKEYVQRSSLVFDIAIIVKTVMRLAHLDLWKRPADGLAE